MLLSVIVPCFNEEKSLPYFFKEMKKIEGNLPLEVEYILIDDGSTDQTLRLLKQQSQERPQKIHYFSFSRNFGKEAAIYAGLQNAKGDYVTLMDADLQDPPQLLVKMYDLLIDHNLDCVATRRKNRDGEPKIRSLFARLFYRLMNKIGDTELVPGVRDFRLMTRKMVDAVLQITEYNRFSKGIFSWVGFNTEYIAYENVERIAGKTSWSFWQLLKYSIDGIVNFSDLPLNIASFVGAFSCLGSGIALIFIVVRALLFGDPTSGWPSMVSIFLFVGGLQLLCLGIIGKYIGKIFLETKKRPHYLVKESDQDNR
ncbi:glycosyltransferase family 2 protein [Enterococcus dispar]|jgi:glycosyltransferase involved in cell wall biosynthesis|uniref:Glycosyl transferase n=1 Tax=Enterococcus dispar ATCC 51266 TaxID=1139219 RepID=S0KLY9_9ENTE|nr:glycosyltransferase family 2 protein [Enterococcus dispar]EOT41038.1 glycosyl transferase [Enterococcus dispar ATCC 51266]EOW87328.1 glycosyl transferase [Enterococcus dispar ATCC 51266]MCU7356342.1 glycosyltransferase family 2 protein [Enterococcus dispar]MDT2704615.1 glycosyltransferase family 2 protein [Enterococcus dispar]OJG38812.1 glycosyl transferase [Enterococcus dispar]